MAIVVRSDDFARTAERLTPMVDALAADSIRGEVVEFDDEDPDGVRRQVADAAGVLVWADPLTDRGPRSALDLQLSEIAATGTWVSAHPDVIDKIGTKDVLVTTRQLPWGSDAVAYPTLEDLRDRFPRRLTQYASLVVKADRGNGGRTVWKVTLLESPHLTAAAPLTARVMVQHARARDDTHTLSTLEGFLSELAPIFTLSGHAVDQPYEPGICEGIIRCYLVRSAVVGFALQGSSPAPVRRVSQDPRVPVVLGVPSPKTMLLPDHPDFGPLRHRLENEWIPAMCTRLDIAEERLPVLWDIDLIRGEPAPEGPDRFVLCEINASSVIPFPPLAPRAVSAVVREAVGG